MSATTTIRGLLVRGGTLLAIVVALAIVINLSLFDEPLHPDVLPFETPEPVSMEDNSYPLIFGLPAAGDKDPLAAGLAIVQELRNRYLRGESVSLSAAEMGAYLGGAPADEPWRASFPSLSCNARIAMDCAQRLIAEVGHADPNQPRLRLLLDRYEAILRASRFAENQEFDRFTPVPVYALVMQVARIRLAIGYEQGPQALLARTAEDIAFWKTMLREGQTLIAKMVALAGIRNDLTFLSALLQERDLGNDDIQSLRRIVEPLTTEERDIGETFLFELRIMLLARESLAVVAGGPSFLLLQENATANEFYRTTIKPMRLRAALTAEEFYRQTGYEQLTYTLRAFPPPLYNLGGKLMLKHQAGSYNLPDYISHVHDLNGRISLVALQAEIESKPGESVADIVRSSSQRNPYTLEPMDYDPQAETIGFECLTESGDDVCRVAVGRAR